MKEKTLPNVADVQRYKPNNRVKTAKGEGVVWSFVSQAVSNQGKFSHWDRSYVVRYSDGSTGDHKESEITLLS